ncbi:MAG: zf-TFIIB domain-containing protein [Caulobacterales bacterium]|nr:zf-TFIIB domain-containing protein [Caulobacterales bacterium]
MPLLMCPNCSVSMQQVRRHEVELDMCPQCRGVWMDRGELEKVLEIERQASGPGDYDRRDERPAAPSPWSARDEPGDRGRGGHGGGHGGGGHGGGHDRGGYSSHGDKRRRRPSIFDIFD